jgi:hypothetical protein
VRIDPAAGNQLVPVGTAGLRVEAPPVTSVNTKTGAVVLAAADVGAATTAHAHADAYYALNRQLSNDTDLDTVAVSGSYGLAAGRTYTGRPPATSGAGWLLVQHSWSANANDTMQLYLDGRKSLAGLWTRYNNNGTWSFWRLLVPHTLSETLADFESRISVLEGA